MLLKNTSLLSLKVILLLFLFVFSFINKVWTQNIPPDTFVKVFLNDKTNLIGQVIKSKKDTLILRQVTDTISRVHRSQIKRTKRLLPGEIKNGRYYPAIVNADKGTLVQNGFPLQKGEMYFQNNMLIWNEISAGLTDRLSARIGFESFSILDYLADGGDLHYNPAFIMTAKYAIPNKKENYHLGISLTTAHDRYNNTFVDYSFLFLSNTFGNRNHNFTIGLGTQLFGGGYGDKPRSGSGVLETSFLTFSASLRLGSKIALITEHWYIIVKDRRSSEIDYVPYTNSFGFKVLGEKLTWMINIARGDEWGDNSNGFWAPIPILGVAFPLSRTFGS